MSELGPDERRALAAFAEVHTPSTADVRAALARVRARIDGGEVLDDAEPERARTRSGRVVAVAAVVLAIAAVGLIAMRLDLASMLASEVDEPDPDAAYAQPESTASEGEAIERPRQAGHEARREPEPPPPEADTQPDAEEPAIEPAPKPKKKTAGSRAETKRSADATLHAELALLRPAQQALRSGNHRRALQLFDDHARSFPDSALAEERALGRIEALCGLGRDEQAGKAAAAFVRRFPGSPYRDKAARACEAP